jgi:Tat protein secretion system quality control protein TatD with DNase activity
VLEIEFRTLLPSLPEPRPFAEVLAEVRENLTAFPNAMVGEVGLDRAFRVPVDYHATPRILTSFSIPLEHQLAVLEAQLELAVELGRNISIHSVKAQQATIDLLARMKKKHGAERWNRISLDMHSCGLSPQTWRDLEVGGYPFQKLSLIAIF